MEFKPFRKIPRLNRECVVTEKLDGTNASVYISDDGLTFLVGSRNRWITPENDNYGFARWAYKNKDELLKLGPGHHFGEWWGSGCQRGYGFRNGEKRFSLFNTYRWSDNAGVRPSCCHVVPVLYQGPFLALSMTATIERLVNEGSVAAPGFMDPEGIVIFHSASGTLFKKTIKNDENGKQIAEIVQATKNDSRTAQEKIEDGVKFVMGRMRDTGTGV